VGRRTGYDAPMKRVLLGLLTGLVAWIVCATLANLVLRGLWPGYHAVERAMTFTTPMMLARLSIGAVATIVAGACARRVAPASTGVGLALGVLLLALFVPQHVYLWPKFPLWYHAVFLTSLPVLSIWGARLAAPRAAASP
jgi:hypothetical protein